MIKNTACYSRVPITVQAGLHVRKLALHSNRSYGYAFRSRAALTNTNPAPASRDPGEKCGLILCSTADSRIILWEDLSHPFEMTATASSSVFNVNRPIMDR